MHRDEQDMFGVAERDQRDLHQGAPGEVERHLGGLRNEAAQRVLACFGGELAEIDDGQRHRLGRRDDL